MRVVTDAERRAPKDWKASSRGRVPAWPPGPGPCHVAATSKLGGVPPSGGCVFAGRVLRLGLPGVAAGARCGHGAGGRRRLEVAALPGGGGPGAWRGAEPDWGTPGINTGVAPPGGVA